MIFQKSACIETLYTELPFLERFRAAKADGFEFVEFWSWTDKDLAAVKAAADAQWDGEVLYVVEREASYGGKDRITCLAEDLAWLKENL